MLPIPRAGLWRVTIASEGAGFTVRSCADGQTPQGEGGMNGLPGCLPQLSAGAGGSVLFTSTCTMPSGFHIVSHGAFTGDNQTVYRIHTDSVTTGAPMAQMNGTRATDIDGVYQGACPANMPPGSLEMNGSVMTREMVAAQRARAQAMMGAAGIGPGR